MNINIKRFANSPNEGGWTLGRLYINGTFFCFTCEDEKRSVKMKGETRIPAGTYPITFRKVLSEKTKHYRTRYAFFTWHLEIQNVPNFDYVYLHVGNTEKDSDGCILLGMQASVATGTISQSVVAYTKFYPLVSDALKKGEAVTIKIEDE
jgi:hypothetical protein